MNPFNITYNDSVAIAGAVIVHTKNIANHIFNSKLYNTAILLSSSLNGKWHKANIGIDNNLRSNYDRIDEQLLEDDTTDKFSTEASSIKLKLHEYYFTADSGKAIYEKARISNIGSVRRAVRLKRENIKIVIKPIHGRKAFTKYVLLQGVKLLQNN